MQYGDSAQQGGMQDWQYEPSHVMQQTSPGLHVDEAPEPVQYSCSSR